MSYYIVSCADHFDEVKVDSEAEAFDIMDDWIEKLIFGENTNYECEYLLDTLKLEKVETQKLPTSKTKSLSKYITDANISVALNKESLKRFEKVASLRENYKNDIFALENLLIKYGVPAHLKGKV